MKQFTTGMLNKKVEFFADDKKRVGVIVGFKFDEFECEETGTLMFGGMIYTIEEETKSGKTKQYEIHENDIM